MAAHITIPDTSPRVSYTATSGQTAFAIPFPFFLTTQIAVWVNGAAVLSGFTITGTPVPGGFSGGALTFSSGRTAGDVVVLSRQTTIARTSDFPSPSSTLAIGTLNTELDRIFAIEQEQRRDMARAIRAPDSEDALDPLPPAAERAGQVVTFDENGDLTTSFVLVPEAVPELLEARDEAVQAAEDALVAAAGANGVIVLAGIAGGPTAFTSTTDIAPTQGLRGSVVFNVDPGASPTMKLGAQTARSIRQADTSAILDGMLKAGPVYDFEVRLVSGTPVFCILNIDDEERSFTGRTVIRASIYNVSYKATLAGEAKIRESYVLTTGEIFGRVGGDGVTLPSIAYAYETTGAYRNYVSIYEGIPALGEAGRVSTDHRPPLTYANTKRLIGAPPRSNSRTATQRLTINSTRYYQLGGLDQHRDIIITQAGSGTWLDFVHTPKGATFNIICEGTAVVHLFTGDGIWTGNGTTPATMLAHSWVNTGGKLLTSSAGAWLRVRRGNLTFLAVADSGSVSAAALLPDVGGVPMPAADLVIGHGPQSWSRDLRENGAAGAVPTMELLGLGSSLYTVDTASVGGSSLLYFPAKATLSYWNAETDAPTQRLDDMVAAIVADQARRTELMGTTAPAMSAFAWCEGLNLMGFFGPSGTHPYNNPAVYTASIVKACQYLNAETGLDLVHIITPLTSQKFGTFSQELWYAVRMAQLRAPAAGLAASPPVTIVIGTEIYGDPRAGDEEAESGERHYDYDSHAVQSERLVMAIDNAVNGASNHLGPFISGIASGDSGAGIEWDVTVNYGTGKTPNKATRPEAAGFRLLPAATGNPDVDDFITEANCLPIRSTRWLNDPDPTSIRMRVTLTTAYTGGTPRPCVLYGSAEATEEASCLIYTIHPVTSKRYYLRQYLYS